MSLDFIESPFGSLPLIEGKSVCSQRNPWIEADKWVQSLDLKENERVFVIGGGAGFHLSVLSRKGIQFNALELNQNFKSYLEKLGFSKRVYSQLPTDLLSWDRIVSFRPAWQTDVQGYERIFSEIFRTHVDNYTATDEQQKKALDVLRSLIKT